MNNQNNKLDISSIIQSNIILVSITIFVVVFIILNYNKVIAGETSNINIINTLLVTFTIILVLYLFTMDDNAEYEVEEELEIPKFKLNEVNEVNKDGIKGGGKYKICNNKYSNINDFDNTNIFISQKHIGKYGIKF
jgi:hypothetical protein